MDKELKIQLCKMTKEETNEKKYLNSKPLYCVFSDRFDDVVGFRTNKGSGYIQTQAKSADSSTDEARCSYANDGATGIAFENGWRQLC